MKKLTAIFILVIMALNLTNCGRRGPMKYPGGQKKPVYDKILDPGNYY